MTGQKIVLQSPNLVTDDASQWNVLVVDDEPDNREIAETVLSFNGVKVLTAIHGADGLKLIEDSLPTFILLDLSMPVMDGWEMIKTMRANPKTQGIPVIALTAHAMAGDREKAYEAGFDGYIAKPFRIPTFMAELKSCLRNVIEHSKVQAAK